LLLPYNFQLHGIAMTGAKIERGVLVQSEFEILDDDPKFRKDYQTMFTLEIAEKWIRNTYPTGREQF
jgi:hypothetical protein